MNIVEIKTGKYYDSDYSEYRFKTNHPRRDIYDDNFKLTPSFLDWLRRNHPTIYNEYICDPDNFEIIYLHFDDIELIP